VTHISTGLVSVADLPLVVDVDGTLIKTDLLHETTLQFIAQNPMEIWRLPVWLAGGKQRLKCELAQRVHLETDTLPLREETLARIRDAQRDGREVYLASASEQGMVARIAEHIGGIAGVFGTDLSANAAGAKKAERLNTAFGRAGYDYIGDRPVDFAVWRDSRRAIAVSHGSAFTRRLRRTFPDAEVLAEPRTNPLGIVKAMRPHQWAKNALVFLSMIAGHHLDVASLGATTLAFACFCLAASSAYIVNDLLDLPADREHPRKCRRPFASGSVPIPVGVAASVALMALAMAGAALLPLRFDAILFGYVALTLAYSLYLKRKLLVDVIVLGGLYTMRVLGGIAATATIYSPWLLMFCLFLFLCLAIVKRCSELVARRESGKSPPPGRAYREGDLDVLRPLGAASGYGAILIVALYLSSVEVRALYTHSTRMWLIMPPMLYWISRILMRSNRGEIHDDPVVFALTDRVSWLTGLVVAAIIAVSI
jgi:4-hydroxybenzoate polyprenyltransferase